ncbi:hypothetical protein BD309DRAFT_949752 [Dichomitus squalens]|nr:hypothetical protein BD309DRAFT_949752 [Dichomitus squalens]
MPPSASRRQSLTPYLPGAWPSCSRDQHDDTAQDADVSSVSSYGGSAITANARSRKEGSRKARRRWTYTGPVRPYVASSGPHGPPGLTYANVATLTSRTPSDPKLSPITISTALSSPLHTPDLADWPTHPDANGRLDRGISSNSTTLSSEFFPFSSDLGTSSRSPRLAPSASREHPFPSPHLDPPLLNFIPGLPPLKLPVHSSANNPFFPESPPAPPSPPLEACLTPASLAITPTGWESTPSISQSPDIPVEFLPVVKVTRSSSLPPTSSVSTDSHLSEADSPVLPSGSDAHAADSHGAVLAHLSIPASEMDAFALAAAVASSASRSSFSIPPSVQSGSHPSTPMESPEGTHRPDLGAYRHPSGTTEASAGHLVREEQLEEDRADVASEHTERVIARRLSAPQPTVHQTPRPQPVPTVRSRVAVGDGNGPLKRKVTKRPVMGKVRKLGERLRDLFRGRAEVPSKTLHSRDTPEYGLMTTTTAITNVEYESEHPIPSPSPRTKKLRNHRRSLPLPALLPTSINRVHTSISKRAALEHDSTLRTSTSSTRQPSALDGDDHCGSASPEDTVSPHSPRTPKGRPERTQTLLQPVLPVGSEGKPGSGTSNKARRFSLSSALSKSRMDSLRTTVIPRPPLPSLPLRETTSAQASTPDAGELSTPRKSSSSPRQDRFWGGELPNTVGASSSPVAGSAGQASPVRSRTRTAPPQALSSPDTESSTAKDKRSRRFSLSSIMAKRSTRHLTTAGHISELSSPTSLKKTKGLSPRGPPRDTVTTVTHANVQFDMVSPRPELDLGSRPPLLDVAHKHRSSQVPSVISSTGESTYYDAKEELSEDEHCARRLHRPSASMSESDLDSMSFARTPDHSSGTFSFGSSTEREYYHQNSELSSESYTPYRSRRPSGPGYTRGAVGHLVGESTSTPVTKTLRFSPSLSLSFDLSCSDVDGDEDDLGRLDQEEELSFMRALGFEFDEIARRVREEPL